MRDYYPSGSKNSYRAPKVHKPKDIGQQLSAAANQQQMIYRKRQKAQQRYARVPEPERDIVDVVTEEARLTEFLLNWYAALGVGSAEENPRVQLEPRGGNAPLESFLLLLLIALGLVTGTAAEVRAHGLSRGLGGTIREPHADPEANAGRPGPDPEPEPNPSEPPNVESEPLPHGSEFLQEGSGFKRVPREATQFDGDPFETKNRRRGDDHDRPQTHHHEYDPEHDPDHTRDDPTPQHALGNATIYPATKLSMYMRRLINSAAVAPTLLIPAFRKLGFDPNEKLEFSEIRWGATNMNQHRTLKLTPIEVVAQLATTEKISDDIRPKCDRGRELVNKIQDTRRFTNFFSYHVVDPLKFEFVAMGTRLIVEKLRKLGFDPDAPASLYEVEGRSVRHPEHLKLHEDSFKRYADLGNILKIEKDGVDHYFAIVPHHPDMLIRVPAIHGNLWKVWMAEHGKKLLYKDPDSLTANLRFAPILKEKSGHTELNYGRTVIEHIFKPIVENTIKSLSSLVMNETPAVTALHMVLGLYVPLYDFGRALVTDDFNSAVAFLALEFVPITLSTGKRVVTGLFVGSKLPHSISKIFKKVEETVPTAYNMVKDLHGLGFIKRSRQLGRGFQQHARNREDHGHGDGALDEAADENNAS